MISFGILKQRPNAHHEDTLPVKSEQDSLQSVSEAVVYLETVVAAMRRLGVSEFDGIKLGPPPSDGTEAEDNGPAVDAAKVEQRAREERRRVALASSGGPLRRVEPL
jgi:hypothetical protein